MNKEFTVKVKLDTVDDADVVEILNSSAQCNKINGLVTKAVKEYCRNEDNSEIEESNISSKIREIREKQDIVFKETLKLMALAKTNNVIGIGKRAENSAVANFLLERQTKNLQESLGNLREVYESDKLQEVNKIADEVVEFICENYQDIINEFKSHVVETVVQKEISDITVESKTKENKSNSESVQFVERQKEEKVSVTPTHKVTEADNSKKVNSAEANGFDIVNDVSDDLMAALQMLGR